MKYLLFTLMLLSNTLVAQQLDTISSKFYHYQNDSINPFGSVAIFQSGDTLVFNDGAIVINSFRLSLYEAAKNAVIGLNTSATNQLIQQYQNKITLLERKNKIYEIATQNIVDSVNAKLNEVTISLDTTKAALNDAEMNIDEAQVLLNNATDNLETVKRNIWIERCFWFVGVVSIWVLSR